jgi:hypothetical protein
MADLRAMQQGSVEVRTSTQVRRHIVLPSVLSAEVFAATTGNRAKKVIHRTPARRMLERPALAVTRAS